mgnify:CR=1 FL=1
MSAPCLVRFDTSILNLRDKASKDAGEPGNFCLANINVSNTLSFEIFLKPEASNSLFKNFISKLALCIMRVDFLIKLKNASGAHFRPGDRPPDPVQAVQKPKVLQIVTI